MHVVHVHWGFWDVYHCNGNDMWQIMTIKCVACVTWSDLWKHPVMVALTFWLDVLVTQGSVSAL